MSRIERTRGRWTAFWLLGLGSCLACGLTGGCGTTNPYPSGTYERARFWFDNGRYQDAADAYGVFVRQNPTDSLAAQAQFEKARAYMKTREFPLAAVEFQILVKDHPISPLVEDALYYQGECYYLQVGRVERDVTPAHEARLHWLEFARNYPLSAHLPQVQRYMAEIADLMVRKRLQQADVYRRLGHWEAAAISLDRTLHEEPSSGLLDEVLWQRARAAEKMKEPDVAIAMYQRLVAQYPQSAHRGRAREALKRLAPADAALP